MAKKETESNIQEQPEQEPITALAVPADESLVADTPNAFAPSLREQVELDAELMNLRQELEDGFGETTKPRDLADAGTIFDIIDCYQTTMIDDKGDEQPKVVFSIVEQETGIVHKVMQSDDSRGIRRKYATLFSYCKARGIPVEPLTDYRFVYGNKEVAGNKAVILERAVKNFHRAA